MCVSETGPPTVSAPLSLPERGCQWNTTRPRARCLQLRPQMPKTGKEMSRQGRLAQALEEGRFHSGSGLSDGS